MNVNRQVKPMHAEIGAHIDLKNRKKRKMEYPAMVNRNECSVSSYQQTDSFGFITSLLWYRLKMVY